MESLRNLKIGLLLLLSVQFNYSFAAEIVTFETSDKVTVTGDLYLVADENAPFIILFHQAFYSRGEYLEIAPKLNAMGYNTLAIDQRFGNKVNGIANATLADAKAKRLARKHRDSYPDLEAALDYVKLNHTPQQLIVWGSSYSASLSLVLAAKHKEIDAVLTFSPGEYFKFEGKKFSEWAKEIESPVFITSSKKETKKRAEIFAQLSNNKSVQFKPDFAGFHGSKALWGKSAGNEEYWLQVTTFLSSIN